MQGCWDRFKSIKYAINLAKSWMLLFLFLTFLSVYCKGIAWKNAQEKM